MPSIIRLFLKMSLICFVITFASGVLFMLANAIWLIPMPRGALILHAYVGFVGWLGLMVMALRCGCSPSSGEFSQKRRDATTCPPSMRFIISRWEGSSSKLSANPSYGGLRIRSHDFC